MRQVVTLNSDAGNAGVHAPSVDNSYTLMQSLDCMPNGY